MSINRLRDTRPENQLHSRPLFLYNTLHINFLGGWNMARHHWRVLLIASVLSVVGSAQGVLAGIYWEEFSSTEYLDAANTTALVDTAAGELRLQPFQFESIGGFDTPGETFAIRFSGDLLIVADRHSGLEIYDLVNPGDPQLVGTSSALADVWGLAINGTYIYCGDGYGDFKVIDFSDPADPTYLGGVTIPGSNIFCRGVANNGSIAYLAAGYAGLQVIDASDPVNPVIIGSYDSPGDAFLVTIRGNLAFLGDSGGGLAIIDITDPTTPSLLSTVSSGASGCAVSGDFLYVNAGLDGLEIYDISNPSAPSLIGSYVTTFGNGEVVVGGDQIVVVAAEATGTFFFDVWDPYNPQLLSSYPSERPWGLDISGTLLAIGDRDAGFDIVQANPLSNVAQSLQINPPSCEIYRVRLNAETYYGTFNWQVSTQGGAFWDDVPAMGTWVPITIPGADLRWRVELQQEQFGLSPICLNLEVEWDLVPLSICSIVDVPNDQGRKVRLSWSGSYYDGPEDDFEITGYAIWRRIDDLRESGSSSVGHGLEFGSRAYPPGDWDYITTVPARGEDEYNAVVPTLCDSTDAGVCLSTFFVSALTPDPLVFFDSNPASGYSVDNLSPDAPGNLQMIAANLLSWDEVEAEDLSGYSVYSSEFEDFSSYELIGTTSSTQMEVEGTESLYLAVAAKDFAGNESEFSVRLLNTTSVSDAQKPSSFVLNQNVPNPFNPCTDIQFALPKASTVTLRIFDIAGRSVKELVSAEYMAQGWHTVTWQGKDERGRAVSSGVYFYRLEAGHYIETRGMTLIK